MGLGWDTQGTDTNICVDALVEDRERVGSGSIRAEITEMEHAGSISGPSQSGMSDSWPGDMGRSFDDRP